MVRACWRLNSSRPGVCRPGPRRGEEVADLVITAVHYTHMSATFAASFLLRLARLLYVPHFHDVRAGPADALPFCVLSNSPDECDLATIMNEVEELAGCLSKSELIVRLARERRLLIPIL